MNFFMMSLLLSSVSLRAAEDTYVSCKWEAVEEPHTCFIDVSCIGNNVIKFSYDDSDIRPSKIFAVKFWSNPDKVFHINRFPTEIFTEFPNIKELLISSQLKSLSTSDFELGVNLEILDLFFNELNTLSENLFVNLSKLQKLDFTFNEINVIEDNAFNGLNSLQTLTLAGNRISKLKINTLKGMPNLETLDLQYNFIEDIEEDALDFPRLQELNLSNNKLKSLNNQPFKHCIVLKSLLLRDNGLISIGAAISAINSIEILDLSDNKLCDIRLQELISLPKLNKLLLSGNGPSVNDSIFDEFVETTIVKPSISILKLQGNGISSRQILNKLYQWGATQLETLDLTDNMMREIDFSFIDAFSDLKSITLFSNPLECTWFDKVMEQKRGNVKLDVDGYFSLKCRNNNRVG